MQLPYNTQNMIQLVPPLPQKDVNSDFQMYQVVINSPGSLSHW